MKTLSISILLISIISLTAPSSFGQESKKTAEARKNVEVAKQNLREAKVDSAADYQAFKLKAEKTIHENEDRIVELQNLHRAAMEEADKTFTSKVTNLTRKNDELKKQIASAENVKTTQWSSFKLEFNHDMDELGRAFRNFMAKGEQN